MDDDFRKVADNRTPRQQAGSAGEIAALEYLRERGLTLVLRNFRCKVGEIDLVMLDTATPVAALVLLEVRYRTDTRFGGAAASVTWRKQRRIVKAAQYLLLTRQDLRRYPARFGVIAVSPGTASSLRVDWIKNAFTL